MNREIDRSEVDAECRSCADRRTFLRLGFGTALAGALAALLPEEAWSTPVRWIHDAGSGGAFRYEIPPADGVDVDRENEVILVRRAGVVAAFALSCPHQRSMLRWRDRDGIFQCTKHHSEYTAMGEYMKGRATRNMDRLRVSIEGGQLVVDPSTKFLSDEDPEGWAAAAVAVP